MFRGKLFLLAYGLREEILVEFDAFFLKRSKLLMLQTISTADLFQTVFLADDILKIAAWVVNIIEQHQEIYKASFLSEH